MKIDKESINPSLLETIEIDSDIRQTCCTTLYAKILSSVYGQQLEYEIEIEYVVDHEYINDRSLDEYIETYESAELTQEEITSMVFEHINDTVDTEVHVDVRCREWDKQTWVSGESTNEFTVTSIGGNDV